MPRVTYRLSLPEPHTHLVEVEVRIPAVAGPLELVMPSWTPGSYLLREFPRNVQDFAARDRAGHPLPWEKTDKNRWRVEARGAKEVRVAYRVYANELTVRTSHVDASHAFINGASVLMFVQGRDTEPLDLVVQAPRGWRIATSLPRAAGRFRARDYDHLVDSPLEIGTHQVLEWEQEGKPHRYAIWGRGSYHPERLVADTRRIVETVGALFGPLPYAEYTFILHLLPEGRGGLEHADSCALQVARWGFQGEEYESFLALVAHEFFHTWNAKRIRPAAFARVDYTRENYTRTLWVLEGLTTYYTDLMLRRAGIITPERYLARLAESIARYRTLPGRAHQSLSESSFDTWIKFYRPDEHTPNSQVSYYHKGALVGLLLDLAIRERSGGERSLDDVMRLLWARRGSDPAGFGEDEVERMAEEVYGGPLGDFFGGYLYGTAELDFDRHLAAVGLELCPTAAPANDPAAHEHRLGVRVKSQEGRTRVTHVLAGTPAHRAGVNAGDELLALDGVRVDAADLPRRLQGYAPGSRVELTLFRRDVLTTIPVEVAPAPTRPRLAPRAEPTERQAAELRRWLAMDPTARLEVDPCERAG